LTSWQNHVIMFLEVKNPIQLEECCRMSKKLFVQEVQGLVAQLSPEAMEYFVKTYEQKRVNAKAAAKADVMKAAILKFLQENQGKAFDRIAIGDALFNDADIPEEYLLNEKNGIAYNSITAFANALQKDGIIKKDEVKEGKRKVVKYCVEGEPILKVEITPKVVAGGVTEVEEEEEVVIEDGVVIDTSVMGF
jgi:hypothetical protein